MESLSNSRIAAAVMHSPTGNDNSFRMSQSKESSFRLSREISGRRE